MTQKYTPAPWHAVWNKHYYEITSDSVGQIGDACISQFCEGIDDQGKANATLMAAAPELLEALEEALKWLDNAPFDYSNGNVSQGVDEGTYYGTQGHLKITAQLRVAIAKAKGEA